MTASALATLPFDTPVSGDATHERFESLAKAYSADLYRYAYWLCRDRSLAEDLVQETFLRAWRAMKSIRDVRAAKAWLLTILRREHARQYERHQPRFEELDMDNLPGWDGDDKRPEAFLVRRAIAALPAEYREPLVLQVLGGYSTAEIGQLLGLTRGAVMTRVFRARQKLREVLDDQPARQDRRQPA